MSEQEPSRSADQFSALAGLGRAVRAGAAADAGLADRRFILQRIHDGNRSGALEALDHVHHTHGEMLEAALEWARQCPVAAAEHLATADNAHLNAQAIEQWRADTASLKESAAAEQAMTAIEMTLPGVADMTAAVSATSMLAGLTEPYQRLREQIHDGDAVAAATSLDRYFLAARIRHDALFQYPSSYATVVLRELGQSECETFIRYSLQETRFHPGLFELAKSLAPADLAAFLAEHLRAHFSGPGRDGSVRVDEDNDAYRLRFDPCGSGGAIRRRLQAAGNGPDRLAHATPMTWQRADEVPPFCAHCAYNEIRSVELLGYPLVVTEFDPDASKPCGWTIYKDPTRIPRHFYTRIGMDNDANDRSKPATPSTDESAADARRQQGRTR